MKHALTIGNGMSLISLLIFIGCSGQKPFGTERLTFVKEISLTGVSGRIDHIAIDTTRNIVYVAGLGNNTVEVADLTSGQHIFSIKNLDEPQGVAFIAASNELVVANGGNGECIFYNCSTYAINATIKLGDDADNVRYDEKSNRIFVGYGSGNIAVIDVINHKLTNNIKLSGHPESFQIDNANSLLFVNVPGDNTIVVIDLNTFQFKARWNTGDFKANFPMALDTADNEVIIGFRHPARLVSYDAMTGQQKASADLVSDVDDVFYFQKFNEIVATGGGGGINVYKKDYKGINKTAFVPTRAGARTSLFVPSTATLIVAERAGAGKSAALAIYKLNEQTN